MAHALDDEPETWICPGPEYPPDDETCGRILDHDGRCPECTRRRTLLRKQAARIRRTLAAMSAPTAAAAKRSVA